MNMPTHKLRLQQYNYEINLKHSLALVKLSYTSVNNLNTCQCDDYGSVSLIKHKLHTEVARKYYFILQCNKC